jgi:trans-L-3-hydroxyproline dehydratase
MCGHATIAFGRFLVDTHDLAVFPRRDSLVFDPGLQSYYFTHPAALLRLPFQSWDQAEVVIHLD